jgi:hypothetical protein
VYKRQEDDKNYKSEEVLKNIVIDRTTPLANPPILTANSSKELKIKADAKDTNELKYKYNRNDADITEYIDADTYVDKKLIPNTQYTYKYKVTDAAGNESDYTDEVSKYTLALDPTDIKVVSKTNESITFEIMNAEQGNIPETKLELKTVGAKESDPNIAESDFSTNTTRTLKGLSEGTDYELWVQTKNCDGIENKKYLALDDVKTNIVSTINITTADNQMISKMVGYGNVIISGDVKDGDIEDVLKVYYRIDGKDGTGKQIGENIIADGENQVFNYSLNLSELSEGIHTLYIWVVDNKGGKSNEIIRKFIIDNTAPTLDIVKLDSTLKISMNDSGTGIVSLTTPEKIIDINSESSYIYEYNINTYGTYTFTVTVTDAAGNNTTKSYFYKRKKHNHKVPTSPEDELKDKIEKENEENIDLTKLENQYITFKDIQNHWAKEDIELLANEYIVKGISKDLYYPNKPITKDVFRNIITKALGKKLDITLDKGNSENITREEMAVYIYKIVKLYDENSSSNNNDFVFKDSKEISEWAEDEVYSLTYKDLIYGRIDESYDPKALLTRAEATAVVKRLKQKLNK